MRPNPSDTLDNVTPVPESGCWIYLGRKQPNGYGKVQGGVWAHRAAWEREHGPIPAGRVVCHKCDVRDCVNPAHLFIGSQQDNIRDASAKGRMRNWNRAKTHCKRGHPFSGDNLRIVAATGERRCRECCRRAVVA